MKNVEQLKELKKKPLMKNFTVDSEFVLLEVGDHVSFYMDRGTGRECMYGKIIKIYANGFINVQEVISSTDPMLKQQQFETVWTKVNPQDHELIRQNDS